jgi:cytochrome b
MHYTGHNPAGGWAIVLLLTLALLAGASGWLTYQEVTGEWMGEVHEAITAGMLTLVLVHVAGVVVSSKLHGENLARAMITGFKQGAAGEAVASRAWVLPVLLSWIAACAWWFSR